jgi:hypothetical protein
MYILGQRRYLPKFANSVCRYPDISVYLNPHLIWQAAKSYVERGDAFGLVSHDSSYTPPGPAQLFR